MNLPILLAIAALIVVTPLAAQTSPVPAGPAPEAPSEGGPPSIAVVNGEPILLEEIEPWLARLHGEAAAGPRGDFDLERLVDRMIDERLLAQEARTLDMHAEQPILGFVERFRRGLLRDRLERREVVDPAQPTEQELQQEYGREYKRVQLTVITVDDKTHATELRDRIAGGEDMAALARAESIDPYAPRGGNVADVPRTELLDEIARLAFSLTPGELGGPVRTDLGWSVLRVERFTEADPERFEERRGQIANVVRARKTSLARAELAARLRQDHPVEIDEELTAAMRPVRLPDGRLAPEVGDRNKIVARIGELLSITAGQYADALLLRWSGVRNEEAAIASSPMVLDRMIEEGLMVAEAQRAYGEGSPEIEAQVRAYETKLLAQRYHRDLIAGAIEVPDADVRAYYDENVERFGRPPRVNLRQITVATAEEAERIAGLLREGADAAWLARRHSIDRFREVGGDRGWTAAGAGPDALSKALVDAGPGDVLGPFGALENYRVILVTAREEQGPVSYEEASDTIRAGLRGKRVAAARAELLQKLRDRSEIVVNTPLLRSLRISGSNTAEQ